MATNRRATTELGGPPGARRFTDFEQFHAAIRQDHPLYYVLQFLGGEDVNSALRHVGKEGMPTLHLALQLSKKHEVCDHLFRLCHSRAPDLLIAQDNEGNTPLHLILQYGRLQMWMRTRLDVLQIYPQAACIANKSGDLPLHVAIKGEYCSLEGLTGESLIQVRQLDPFKTYHHNARPFELHLPCSSVDFVMSQRGSDALLPCQLALKLSGPSDAKRLLELSPPKLGFAPFEGMFPFMWAASRIMTDATMDDDYHEWKNKLWFTLSYELARKHPQLIGQKNLGGAGHQTNASGILGDRRILLRPSKKISPLSEREPEFRMAGDEEEQNDNKFGSGN